MPTRLRPILLTVFACLALEALIVAFVVLVPRLAQAATIDVPAGSSLQAAINSASSGDTLRVQAGTFTESLIITKSLTLLGGFDPTFTTRVPRTTVISATGPGIDINGSGIQATVDGFEIRRAVGGIRVGVQLDSKVVINDNFIHDNVVDGGIGGQAQLRSEIVVSNNAIVSNTHNSNGGGISLQANQSSQVTVLTNTIISNTAAGTGGGVLLRVQIGSRLSLENNDIMTNTAMNGSGGASLSGQLSSQVQVAGNRILSNTADATGGVQLDGLDSDLVFAENTVRANQALSGTGGVSLQSVFGGSVTVRNVTLERNAGAEVGGGEIELPFGTPLVVTGTNRVISNTGRTRTGGLRVVLNGSDGQFSGLDVLSNTTQSDDCGGMSVLGAQTAVHIDRARISGNQGDSGGLCLLGITSAMFEVVGSTISGNQGLTKTGGLYVPNLVGSSRLLISGTDVISNRSASAGGVFLGVAVQSSVEIRNSAVERNEGALYGGLTIATALLGNVTIEESRIQGNRAQAFGGCGMLVQQSGTFRFRKNIVERNVSDALAGCAFQNLISVESSIEGNLVRDNVAASAFSGLSFQSVAFGDLNVHDNQIISNRVGVSNSLVTGGDFSGLTIQAMTGGTLSLERNRILSNTAVISSNGTGGTGAGLNGTVSLGNATIRNNTVSGNQAQNSTGGVDLTVASSAADISENVIQSNGALTRSAGLHILAPASILDLRRNTVINNSAPQQAGLSIEAAILADLARSENNVIAGNSGHGVTLIDSFLRSRNDTIANNGGAGIFMTGTVTTTASLSNTIIYGNGTAFGRTTVPAFTNAFTLTAGFSDIQGGWPGVGNLNVTPLFVGPTDFRLQAGSPLIGVGSNAFSPAVDHDGIPRPVPVGGIVDIGAYEWFVAGVSFAPNSSQTGAPGTVVTYTLQVTNTGNLPDTFLLDLPINPLGWTATVPVSTGPLTPSGATTVQVLVTVPAGALGGLQNTITARARSASDGTILGIATLQTTVANVANLTLVASQSATVSPGTVKVYSHTLTNNGNFTDTIALQAASNAGFPVALSAPSIILAPGASATVVVSVTVPSSVTGGTVNTTLVTAISSSSLGNRTATVTDVTTADQHRIALPLAVKDAGGW